MIDPLITELFYRVCVAALAFTALAGILCCILQGDK